MIYCFVEKILISSEKVKAEFTQITGVSLDKGTKCEDIVNKILFTYFLPMSFSSTS